MVEGIQSDHLMVVANIAGLSYDGGSITMGRSLRSHIRWDRLPEVTSDPLRNALLEQHIRIAVSNPSSLAELNTKLLAIASAHLGTRYSGKGDAILQ